MTTSEQRTIIERMRRTNFLRNWSPYAEEYARNASEPNCNGGVRLLGRGTADDFVERSSIHAN